MTTRSVCARQIPRSIHSTREHIVSMFVELKSIRARSCTNSNDENATEKVGECCIRCCCLVVRDDTTSHEHVTLVNKHKLIWKKIAAMKKTCTTIAVENDANDTHCRKSRSNQTWAQKSLRGERSLLVEKHRRFLAGMT